MQNCAGLADRGWRTFAALVCALSVALGIADTADAQGPADPNNVLAVDGPAAMLADGTQNGTPYSAKFETSFEPQHIQPGEGFTYVGATTDDSDPIDECVPHYTGDELYVGFYKVPAGTTYLSSDIELGPGVQVLSSTTAATCPTSGGNTYTSTHVVSGAATADVEPGCYQGDNANNYLLIPGDDLNSGGLSTLRVGNVPGGCDPTPQCKDTFHNDSDGLKDHPADPGCSVANDPSELNVDVECDNGEDDDGDSKVDWPADEGCNSASDGTESAAECDNGVNDDFDGLADLVDPGCTSAADNSELGNVECDDGEDNDADGSTDWPADTDCEDVLDDIEESICDGPLAQDDVLPFDDATPPPLSPFPNDDAACAAVWVPELEDGFVAQGLALMDDGTALLSGYIHPLGDPKDDESGEHCRIAQVDLTTGDFLGGFDFKRSTCAHGGGIAIDSDGRVWISDTNSDTKRGKLILLTGPDIFTDPIPVAAKLGKGEGLKGSFLVDGRSDHLWVGTFIKTEDGPAGKIYEFETDYLVNATIDGPVKRSASTDIRNVPTETQGAAFKDGALFAAISENSRTGLLKTDHGTFGFGPGVEEIQFEGECLWAVFEAGAMIYQRKSFPVIARFDPGLIPDPFDPHPECVAE